MAKKDVVVEWVVICCSSKHLPRKNSVLPPRVERGCLSAAHFASPTASFECHRFHSDCGLDHLFTVSLIIREI